MAASKEWTPFLTSRSPPSPEIFRSPRSETCCRCLNKTLLTSCGPVCPFCKHDFCQNCVIDTVEEYASKLSNGRNVIVHPTGPSHNCQWLLVDESERRRKFEDQEATSARRIRLARGNLSPTSMINGPRGMFDTESSSDEVQVISPLPPRRRAISPPPTKRPRRRAADTVSLTDGPQYSARKKQKVKAETPNWTMEPRLWEAPDGKSRRIRATTSQLMLEAELSSVPDYVQTPESAGKASSIRGRPLLRRLLH